MGTTLPDTPKMAMQDGPQESDARSRWGETPFAAITPCFIAGLLAAGLLSECSFFGLALGALLLAAAAAAAWREGRTRVSWAVGLAALFMGAVLISLADREGYPAGDLRALLGRNELPLDRPLAFDGCVDDPPVERSGEWILTLALRGLRLGESWGAGRGKVLLRLPAGGRGERDAPPGGLGQGDRLRGWGSFRVPRNFQNPGTVDHRGFLARRGVRLVGRAKTSLLLESLPGDCAGWWSRATGGLRSRIASCFRKLAAEGKPQLASVLSSVVLGDYSALDAATREQFQNSGTYHVLVVSGLHVGWIAWSLLGLCRLAGMPQVHARTAAAGAVLLYAGVVGFQASVSRSLWMFFLYLAGQALFRRARPANIAFAAAFFLLALEPDWIFDVGFQLSFLAVAGICLTAIPMIERGINPLVAPTRHAGDNSRLSHGRGRAHRAGRRHRLRWELLAEAAGDRAGGRCEALILDAARLWAAAAGAMGALILVSLSVQVWLEPLLAFHFNRLSWIAIPANLVLVPLSSLVLAAGAAAVVSSQAGPAADPLLGLAAFLASLLLQASGWFAGLPGAWQRCPTPPLGWVAAGVLALAAWSFMSWRGRWIPWAITGLVLLSLGTGVPLLPGPERAGAAQRYMRLSFLDVGDGDAMVLETPGGRIWVVDAGGLRQSQESQEPVFDIGEAVVSRYLWSRWVPRLDRLLLSHPDVDHAGGIPALLGNFRVVRAGYPTGSGDPLFDRIMAAARARGVPSAALRAGMEANEGALKIRVLNPDTGETLRSSNDRSVVLHVTLGSFSALLTGDMERAAEEMLLARTASLRCTLLKVAHHGSRTGTTEAFVRAVQPRWGVISTGRNNPFGHPAPEVVSRLLRHGCRPLLTSDLGMVTVETDGRRYRLISHVCGELESGAFE